VIVPRQSLCCGRPLYDYGMLRLARRLLLRVLSGLREEIRAGTPVIALEPSCGAVLRNELTNMLPDDEDAKRLQRQTFTIGEFLARQAKGWDAPRLERRALVHFHCHQRATSDTDCDRELLDRVGLDYEVLDTGCCGLAGSFGYEKGERYDVSIKAGEQKLLPAVRDASPDTLILTDGFSCRSQIAHGSPRDALHLAQVVQMALEHGPNGPGATPPEQRYTEPPERSHDGGGRAAIAAGMLGTLGGGIALALHHRRGHALEVKRRFRPTASISNGR
jgi:Fe-S oxidoreductase